jgi:hypothetical protein
MENFAIIIAVIAGLIVGFVFGKKSTGPDNSQYDIRINALSCAFVISFDFIRTPSVKVLASLSLRERFVRVPSYNQRTT